MEDTSVFGVNEATSPCFSGAHRRAVDAKGRFNLPFQFRTGGQTGGVQYVASDGPNPNCLAVFPHEEWVRTLTRMKKADKSKKNLDQIRRKSGGSVELTPDAQGRVAIPPERLESAGIGRKVLVVGMVHYMELWDPDTYWKEQEALPPPDPEFEEEFFY